MIKLISIIITCVLMVSCNNFNSKNSNKTNDSIGLDGKTSSFQEVDSSDEELIAIVKEFEQMRDDTLAIDTFFQREGQNYHLIFRYYADMTRMNIIPERYTKIMVKEITRFLILFLPLNC